MTERNTAHLTVISGGILSQQFNPNDPADWVRNEAARVSAMVAEAEHLVADATAAEERARQFRIHYEKMRDAAKAHLARLVTSVPDRSA